MCSVRNNEQTKLMEELENTRRSGLTEEELEISQILFASLKAGIECSRDLALHMRQVVKSDIDRRLARMYGPGIVTLEWEEG